jgi:hypothetical protein
VHLAEDPVGQHRRGGRVRVGARDVAPSPEGAFQVNDPISRRPQAPEVRP